VCGGGTATLKKKREQTMFIVGLTKLSDAQLIKGYFSSSERSLMLCWGSKSMQDRSQY
jgi:hypothetical protein